MPLSAAFSVDAARHSVGNARCDNASRVETHAAVIGHYARDADASACRARRQSSARAKSSCFFSRLAEATFMRMGSPS